MNEIDNRFMQEALRLAEAAARRDEVPIGCVIAQGEEIIGRGYNLRNTLKNSLHHAEIIAINEACSRIGDWRLEDTVLYVTVEPCPMCAGAIVQARIPVVAFGARNPKAGCAGSILNILEEPSFNHQVKVVPEVMAEECAALMSGFFKRFRGTK